MIVAEKDSIVAPLDSLVLQLNFEFLCKNKKIITYSFFYNFDFWDQCYKTFFSFFLTDFGQNKLKHLLLTIFSG